MAKTRSRNYPALSLKEAIERARIFYQKEGRAKVDAASAVAAWGYGSLNGASMRALAAVRQYGLLEGGNEDLRLSERALTILLEPENSPDYTAALREALADPALFREVLAEYPDGLPSDVALVSYLVRKQGFGESAARSVVAALRESIELVESRDTSYASYEDMRIVAPQSREIESPKRMPQKEIQTIRSATTWETTLNLSPDSAIEFRIVGSFPTAKQLQFLPQFLELARLQLMQAVEAAEEDSLTDYTVES